MTHTPRNIDDHKQEPHSEEPDKIFFLKNAIAFSSIIAISLGIVIKFAPIFHHSLSETERIAKILAIHAVKDLQPLCPKEIEVQITNTREVIAICQEKKIARFTFDDNGKISLTPARLAETE